VHVDEPAGALLFDGHARQEALLVVPLVDENKLAAHKLHSDWPTAFWKRPGTHGMHWMVRPVVES